MKQVFTVFLSTILATNLFGQVQTEGVLILNGGQFGNPTDNANLSWYQPGTNTYTSLDTIQTQSVQRLIVDGPFAYAAAQDSIVMYDIPNGTRVAAEAFNAPSTLSLALAGDYLLAGNWYLPFGWPGGPFPNHLRVFDRNTLAFVDSMPAVTQPAKEIVVLGDTAYISQNYTSSAFSDSAGWLVKVHVPTLTYVDSVDLSLGVAGLGRLVVQDSIIYGLNSGSNTVSMYDPSTGMAMTVAANADFQLGTTGNQWAFDEQGTFYAKIGGVVATYDLASQMILNPIVVDTSVTEFVVDTVQDRIYLSHTDFFSYLGGVIYDVNGQRLDTFLVGSSPEAMAVVYNTTPVADVDVDTTVNTTVVEIPVLENDVDPDLRTAFQVEIVTPSTGQAVVSGENLVYTPTSGFVGKDSVQYRILDEWGAADTTWTFIEVEPVVSREQDWLPLSWTSYPNPVQDLLHIQ
ncbi:MAG: Ig-like domain-containing protein, partial [Bacteroidota bacterium]